MKKLILIAVAAAALMTPAAVMSTPAEAQSVTVRVGEPGYHRPVVKKRVIVRHAPTCRMVTTRVHRNGRTVVTKTRRCN